MAEVLQKPVGHVDRGVRDPGQRQAEPRPRQPVAVGEAAIRIGQTLPQRRQAERAIADGAGHPDAVAAAGAVPPQRRTRRHVTKDGERQHQRACR